MLIASAMNFPLFYGEVKSVALLIQRGDSKIFVPVNLG